MKSPLDDAGRTTGEGNIGSSDQVSDSEEDSDFVDSDYELEDDDDLFNDNVEDNVVGKGKMIVKGRLKVPTDDVSSDGDGLQLPDSHDEGDIRLGFKCFRQEDMCNPIFKVGMMFESPEMVRKSITQYSLKNMVEIKIPSNDPKRIRPHCDADFP